MNATPGTPAGTDNGRISFRISNGVTGHRTPLDEAMVERVRQVLLHIRDHPVGRRRATGRRGRRPWPATPVVFTLLSSLAEGADRLLAREALEHFAGHDVRLRAILPLKADDYVQDFGSASSRHEFDDLLGRRRRTDHHHATGRQPRAGLRPRGTLSRRSL